MAAAPDSYPSGEAVGKHDLLSVCSLHKLEGDEEKMMMDGSGGGRAYAAAIRKRIDPEERAAEAYRKKSMRIYSKIYTYSDAPTDPRPLSRALVIVGLVEARGALVQEMVIGTDESDPSCGWATSCVVASKLADKPHRRKQLAKDQLDLADNFAQLMNLLQRTNRVALLGADRDGRFGLLRPLEGASGSDRPPYSSLEYAGEFIISTVDEVDENVLAKIETGEIDVTGGSAGGEAVPTTPPMTPPTTPPTTPPGDPPPEDDHDGDAVMWKPPDDHDGAPDFNANNHDNGEDVPMWKPPGGDDDDAAAGAGGSTEDGGGGGGLWKPPNDDDDDGGDSAAAAGGGDSSMASLWTSAASAGGGMDVDGADDGAFWKKRPRSEQDEEEKKTDGGGVGKKKDTFHTDSGADAADRFYSNLKRDQDTRADSRLYHMRAFNGFVKATQISELDPQTRGMDEVEEDDDFDSHMNDSHSFRRHGGHGKKRGPPLRVLDLACGKGGDLGKWTLHPRGLANYVGVDVARGSLKDAAIRARKMRSKLRNRCTFTCADLGSDVPGRARSNRTPGKKLQKLLSWSLASEDAGDAAGDPQFQWVRGGGIGPQDVFDVVSIQFAIHYMMSSRKRARRFFRTVSELLQVGGNLVATTIDARVAVALLMDTGVDFFQLHRRLPPEQEEEDDLEIGAVVETGGGACRLKFNKGTLRRLFPPREEDEGGEEARQRRRPRGGEEDPFGLEYTFTLVEGSDHSAGVGEAVDLAEWLTPLPALCRLAMEAGLELEYALNFHEFFQQRRDAHRHAATHATMYNMKVLNRNGSISADEWQVSRLYMAIQFRKVGPSQMTFEDDEHGEDDNDEDEDAEEANDNDDFGLGGEKAPPSKKSRNVGRKDV